MPHYRDWFAVAASKAVTHSSYRPVASSQDVGSWTLQDNTFRGSKTDEAGWDVGPVGDAAASFAGAGLGNNSFNQPANFWTNGSATSIYDGGFTEGLGLQPEADGYMKFDDIKGEFSPSREARANWDAICDVGTAIQQVSVADALTSGGRGGYWDWSSEPTPYDQDNGGQEVGLDVGACRVDQLENVFLTKRESTSNADALVQQVNGTIGYEMQAGIGSEHWPEPAAEIFATGSAVDSWIEKTFGNGDGEILGGISRGDVFTGTDNYNPGKGASLI